MEYSLLAPVLWQSLALCMARWVGFSLLVPLFGRRHMGAAQRNAICLALALPQIPAVFSQLAAAPLEGVLLIGLAIKEVILGVWLGILVAIPFWTIRGALTLVDNQRGANAAQMANPSLEADSSILGELGERLFLAWLVATGGFLTAFELMSDSLVIWPILQGWPSTLLGDGTRLWAAFGDLMAKTLLFAAPALLLLLLIEFAMALSSTSVKGIDVYQTAMPIKSLATMIFIAVAGYAWFDRGMNGFVMWWRSGIAWTLG